MDREPVRVYMPLNAVPACPCVDAAAGLDHVAHGLIGHECAHRAAGPDCSWKLPSRSPSFAYRRPIISRDYRGVRIDPGGHSGRAASPSMTAFAVVRFYLDTPRLATCLTATEHEAQRQEAKSDRCRKEEWEAGEGQGGVDCSRS
jgi:hypothetical protein